MAILTMILEVASLNERVLDSARDGALRIKAFEKLCHKSYVGTFCSRYVTFI